jgi:hypothetical protein
MRRPDKPAPDEAEPERWRDKRDRQSETSKCESYPSCDGGSLVRSFRIWFPATIKVVEHVARAHDSATRHQRTIPRAAIIALHVFSMRLTFLVVLLGGCAGVSFAPNLGFYGSWHGPQTITFTGSNYEIDARAGHYGSDANTLYFTPSAIPTGVNQRTISCPYTLMGNTLILRDCPFAGEYRR